MRQYIRLALLASLSGPLMMSCTNENEPQPADNGMIPLTLECFIGNTRATDTAFENGDNIGVYAVEQNALIQPAGNAVNNEQFTYNGTSWSPFRTVYWNEGTYDVYAYYPAVEKITDTEDYRFAVSEDQSTHAGYTSSDFIWASAKSQTASANAVSLTFSHRLSKAIVKLVKGEGFSGDIPADCEVYIHSTATEASIDMASGDASSSLYSPTNTIKAFKKDAATFEAIVVPQNISSRRPLVEVIAGGVSYLMEGKISFKPGYSHNIVITLTKNPEQTKIEIGGSIGGWTE